MPDMKYPLATDGAGHDMTTAWMSEIALVVDDERDRAGLDQALLKAGLPVTACDRFAAPDVPSYSRTRYAVIDLIDEVDPDRIDFRVDRHSEGSSPLSLLATASRSGRFVIALVRPESMRASEAIRRAGATKVVSWTGAGPTGAAIARIIAADREGKDREGGRRG